jgi:hypothetical protein
MKYYLDTEFDGFGGELISLALVREDDKFLYLVSGDTFVYDSWVVENVIPILWQVPGPLNGYVILEEFQELIEEFLQDDDDITIIADWPDDIKYFCDLLITGPGTMINIPSVTFEVHRVDAYPTEVEGAVQHNAYWDAVALKALFQ